MSSTFLTLRFVYTICTVRTRSRHTIHNPLRGRLSTPQAIAEALRMAIIEGQLLSGEALRQEELARQFEVSRIPVREALRQLESEGWIVLLPNRGASVAPLSVDEARETYEILAALECAALRLAIPRYTPASLRVAEQALQRAPHDRAEDVQRNLDFHLALYAPAERPRLLSLITMQRQRGQRYSRLYFALPKYQEQTAREHEQILKACVDGDVASAVDLLGCHLLQTGEMLVRYLEEHIRGGSTADPDEALLALQQKIALQQNGAGLEHE